jgi:HK97 family phage portal protein
MRSLVGEIVNAASKVKVPVPYTGRRGGGAFTQMRSGADREAQANAMGANGVLFAIVGGLAVDVSGVEWGLWREAKSGKGEDREPVTAHAALDVFNHPNDFMSRQELFEIIEQHLGLTGEGWPLFVRDKRLDWPVEWWPVYPHRMEPVPDPDLFLAGYLYRSPDGEKIPLDVRDVVLMRQPNPLDLMRGLSAVGAIGVDLESAEAARTWNRNFFLNSALPGGIISIEGRLGDEDFDEFRDRWNEQHRGVQNAHRVAIVEHGGTFQERRYTMRDMEFSALRGLSDEAVRKAFRYPKSLLGDTDTVNRAVAVAQEAMYAKTHMVPRLRRWRGMLNTKFLPQFGATARGLVFDFVSPVPADEEAENKARVSKASAAGVYVDKGWPRKAVAVGLGLPAELVDSADEADRMAEERAARVPQQAPAQEPGQKEADEAAPDAVWRDLVGRLVTTRTGAPSDGSFTAARGKV